MNAQTRRRPAGEILRKSVEKLGIEVHTKASTTRGPRREDKVRGVWLRRRHR